jgi:4-hydroxyphenylpyruvate dioxygenase
VENLAPSKSPPRKSTDVSSRHGIPRADAAHAYKRALSLGAKPAATASGPMELGSPAIKGIDGLRIYVVDQYGAKGSIYDVYFKWLGEANPSPASGGFHFIDHLTHNVERGNMDPWSNFYVGLFNFREIRFFAIDGKMTGLMSRAMTRPCGNIRIPINESAEDKS